MKSLGVILIVSLALLVTVSSVGLSYDVNDVCRLVRGEEPFPNPGEIGPPYPDLGYFRPTLPHWQKQELAHPQHIAIFCDNFDLSAEHLQRAAQYALNFIRTRPGDVDNLVTEVFGVTAENLAAGINFNVENAVWPHGYAQASDSRVFINDNQTGFKVNPEVDLDAIASSEADIVVIISKSPPSREEIKEKAGDKIIFLVPALNIDEYDTAVSLDSEGNLIIDGKNLGKPIIPGVNDDQIDFEEENVYTLVPLIEVAGFANVLKVLSESLDVERIVSLNVLEPTGTRFGILPDRKVDEPIIKALFPDLVRTSVWINRFEGQAPRGGIKFNLQVMLKEGQRISPDAVKEILQTAAENSDGILAFDDGSNRIYYSGYFIDRGRGEFTGPLAVIQGKETMVDHGVIKDVITINGWFSNWSGAQMIEELLVKFGLADPSNGPASADAEPVNDPYIIQSLGSPILFEKVLDTPIEVGLNGGGGRVGRVYIRQNLGNANENLTLANGIWAGNDQQFLLSIATDPAYGRTILDEARAWTEDGTRWASLNYHQFQLTGEKDPSKVSWPKYVIEASGKYKTIEKIMPFVQNGAEVVILTVPPKDPKVKVYEVSNSAQRGRLAEELRTLLEGMPEVGDFQNFNIDSVVESTVNLFLGTPEGERIHVSQFSRDMLNNDLMGILLNDYLKSASSVVNRLAEEYGWEHPVDVAGDTIEEIEVPVILQIVPGANDDFLLPLVADIYKRTGQPIIISNASCTTNSLVPFIRRGLLKFLEIYGDGSEVNSAHLDTTHSGTMSQPPLTRSYAKKPGREQGASFNIVMTTTGASKSTTKVLIDLDDQLMSGLAGRAGNENGSISTITFTLTKPLPEGVTAQMFNDFLQDLAENELKDILILKRFSSTLEIIGTPETSIIHPDFTWIDGDIIEVMIGYDNEYGYTDQVHRLLIRLAELLEQGP